MEHKTSVVSNVQERRIRKSWVKQNKEDTEQQKWYQANNIALGFP